MDNYFYHCTKESPIVNIFKVNDVEKRIYHSFVIDIYSFKEIDLLIENKSIEEMINSNNHWKLKEMFNILVKQDFKKEIRKHSIPYVKIKRFWRTASGQLPF